MSKLKDIRIATARQRKHLPSRSYEAMIWKDWRGYNKWNKIKIIQQAYQRNPAYYSACNIIAQTIADMPIYVQYVKDGKKFETQDHPILRILDRDMSREEFIQRFTLYLVVTGESAAEIIFSGSDRNKRPLGLICLPSQYITPVYGDQYKPIDHFIFQYNKERRLETDEVIFLTKPDLENYFQGMSPGVPLSELVDLNNSGITWNKNVAQNGGVPPIITKAPGGASPEEMQEVQDRWQKQSGANQSHRLKVMSGDLEVITGVNQNPHDAEWVEAIKVSMRMIFMAFGVSSSLMNDAANKTYNNVKDSRKALYTDACLPIGHMIYKKISRDLRPYYKDNPLIKINESEIEALQEDKELQARRITMLVDSGLYSRNEGRVELGKPLSDDEIADKLIISNTPTPVKQPDPPVAQID